MGSILCFISFLFFFSSETDKIPIALLFILGFVSIIQGLNSIPVALIKYKNGILHFENEKIKNLIEVQDVKNFDIKENEILIFDNDNKR